MNNMSARLIKSLILHLPRYAEEEGDFYCVSREGLINALCSEHQIDRAIAENTVNLIENLLDTLAVLRSNELGKGKWCFISYPAQLMTMSILTAMSDKESRFFADNFWNTQGISNNKKDQQRDVLKEVENRRQQHHAKHNAPPIRYIYVAWSVIKLNGNILFYQREDTEKHYDKESGDYGLIGGRLNQRDMPLFTHDKNRCLRILQSNQSELIEPILPETLKRELKEEVSLAFGEHYGYKQLLTLDPYQQVQGAAPNHALTEYHLYLFQIDLTLTGYIHLQQKIKTDERLIWFSLAERRWCINKNY